MKRYLFVVVVVIGLIIQETSSMPDMLQDKAHEVLDRFKERAQEAVEHAQEVASRAADAARSAIQDAMQSAQQAGQEGMEKGHELVEWGKSLVANYSNPTSADTLPEHHE